MKTSIKKLNYLKYTSNGQEAFQIISEDVEEFLDNNFLLKNDGQRKHYIIGEKDYCIDKEDLHYEDIKTNQRVFPYKNKI